MIISDRYKLIFDATPKTGSTSTESYFRALGLTDEEVVHGTIKPDQRKEWKGYLKFTIVRNPYDKAVSWYLYAFKQMHKVYPNAPTELRFEDYLTIYGIWAMKESRVTADGETRVIKLEEISQEIPKIAQEVGLDSSLAVFPHLNTTANYKREGDWRRYYTQEIADRVYDRLKEDFEAFGYSRDSWKF